MWEGTALPHSGHVLSLGARQRLAERRRLPFIFETLHLGTAMVKIFLQVSDDESSV
jgi:hypothetical protein